MNKDNFKKLIDAILFDGQSKFNMGCFIGKLAVDNGDKELVKNGHALASDYETWSLQEIDTTAMFNCDSVGCIAGFATGLANDWKTPDWIKKPEELTEEISHHRAHNQVIYFEEASNTFLGLTRKQGLRLYYGDHDTVWKYLKYYESDKYPDLQYMGEEHGEANDILDHSIPWYDEDSEIFLGSIDYKTAAHVLTRIMNGDIVIDPDDGSINVKELQQSNEKG